MVTPCSSRSAGVNGAYLLSVLSWFFGIDLERIARDGVLLVDDLGMPHNTDR